MRVFELEGRFVRSAFAVLVFAVFCSVPVAYVNAQASRQAAARVVSSDVPAIAAEEYQLKNGLRVVLHRDTSAPLVTVNVRYRVGSKDEVPGKTGLAHLFEHMMFQGSKNYNDDYPKALRDAGASFNGQTSNDTTKYYETLPSNFLERALFLEADRMGGLLDALSQKKLDNQRDVVRNERRQNTDNRPYGTAWEKIFAQMYPAGHPYSWPTIGSLDDLTAASMQDVRAFFQKFYVPSNASLVIAGDFDPKQAKLWVEKYFGPIARGAEIARPKPPGVGLTGEIRKTYEDAVPVSRVYISWHTAPKGSADDAALEILEAIFSEGSGSRLKRAITPSAGATNTSSELGGLFTVIAGAFSGRSPEDVEAQIDSEVDRIKKEAPSAAEMERAVNTIESKTIFGMERLGERADRLNGYITDLGKADGFAADIDRYRKVTAADIQRVAAKYLNKDRLVMYIEPGRRASSTTAAAANGEGEKPAADPAKSTAVRPAPLPQPGPAPKIALPAIDKRKLSNGLNVWIVRRNKLPLVSMSMIVNAGTSAQPGDKAGLASMTSGLLSRGTAKRSANEMADQAASYGAEIETAVNWDSAKVATKSLTKNFDKVLEVYADAIVNPAFAAGEVDYQRRREIGSSNQRRTDPKEVADAIFAKLVYGPDHPYGKSISETSLEAITKQDVENFYAAYYRPNNATLIVVGDVVADAVMPKLETAFGGWKPGEVAAAAVAQVPNFEKPGIYMVDRPGAPQATMLIGQTAVARNSPDYYALQVLNSILGAGTTSRLSENLRGDKGYTYGVRSAFDFRKGAGPFTVSANVQTAVVKEALVESLKELNGIRGTIQVTQKELDENKQYLIRRYPGQFETAQQISDQLADLAQYGLPDASINDYIVNIQRVTVADVARVATQYLHPDQMAIVIVGDRSGTESKLKELNMPISYLDSRGNTTK